MSAHMRGVVVALIGSLAVAACASDGASLSDRASLEDAITPPAGAVPLPLARPAAKSSVLRSTAAQDVWRHLPEPVSIQQFNQDKAKCTRMANTAPGTGSPEIKFYPIFSNCMRSAGYEPGSRAIPRPESPTPDANENRNGLNTYAHATT
jgi:hypothetical protein